MNVVVKKWGDGLGVVIPTAVVHRLDLKDGSVVEFENTANGISLFSGNASRKPSLTELLERVTPENIHKSIDNGAPVGAW